MTSTVSLNLLNHLRIASPCSVKWEHMTPVGDGDRARHCSRCHLNVHNLSGMSAHEAEDFLRSLVPGERVCGVLRRRADGTVITRDCPVGLAAARERLGRWAARAAAALTIMLAGASLTRSRAPAHPGVRNLAQTRPFMNMAAWIRGQPAPPVDHGQWVPGAIDLQAVLQAQRGAASPFRSP